MSFRDTSENEILDAIFNEGTSITTGTHLGVLTNTPGDAGALTEIQTPGSNGYARASLIPANWSAAASGSKTNSANVDFGPATADWATGGTTAQAVFVTTAATGGTPIFILTMTAGLNVLNTQTLRFSPSQITATLD